MYIYKPPIKDEWVRQTVHWTTPYVPALPLLGETNGEGERQIKNFHSPDIMYVC